MRDSDEGFRLGIPIRDKDVGSRIREQGFFVERVEALEIDGPLRGGEALGLAHAVDQREMAGADDDDLPRLSAQRRGKEVDRRGEDEEAGEKRIRTGTGEAASEGHGDVLPAASVPLVKDLHVAAEPLDVDVQGEDAFE